VNLLGLIDNLANKKILVFAKDLDDILPRGWLNKDGFAVWPSEGAVEEALGGNQALHFYRGVI